MTEVGTEFIEYLKAHDPEAFSQVSSDSATEALVNSIVAKHKDTFDIWKKTPEWLRDKYANKIPDEVLDLVKQGVKLTPENITDLQTSYANNYVQPKPADLGVNFDLNTDIVFAAADIATMKSIADTIGKKGYSEKAASQLATLRQIRLHLHEQLQKASGEQRRQLCNDWRKTRMHDIKTIKKDWAQQQPERLFVHILKDLDRGKENMDTALPKLDALMINITKQGREKALVDCLQSPQSRAKHYSTATKDVVEHMLSTYLPNHSQQQYIQQQLSSSTNASNKPKSSNSTTITSNLQEMLSEHNFRR